MTRLIAFCALLLFATPSWAVCTGASFPFDTPSNPFSQAYTVPSVTNGVTFVAFASRNAARDITSGPTIGGNAMTRIGTLLTSTNTSHELFYRLSVAAGSQTIAATYDGLALSQVITAVTCDGINQSSPIFASNTATGSGGTITVNCNSANGPVLDFFGAGGQSAGAETAGPGQSTLDSDIADNLLRAGSSVESGTGGSVAMSQSLAIGGDWTSFCVALNLVASSATRRPLVVIE